MGSRDASAYCAMNSTEMAKRQRKQPRGDGMVAVFPHLARNAPSLGCRQVEHVRSQPPGAHPYPHTQVLQALEGGRLPRIRRFAHLPLPELGPLYDGLALDVGHRPEGVQRQAPPLLEGLREPCRHHEDGPPLRRHLRDVRLKHVWVCSGEPLSEVDRKLADGREGTKVVQACAGQRLKARISPIFRPLGLALALELITGVVSRSAGARTYIRLRAPGHIERQNRRQDNCIPGPSPSPGRRFWGGPQRTHT